jgi:hypothetical protein
MKIWKYSGIFLMATGILHTVVGIVLCRDYLWKIIKKGLFNALWISWEAGFDTSLNFAFWFIVCGIIIIILGQTLHYYIKKERKPAPAFLAYWFLGLSIIGCIIIPVSGLWLFIPQALIIIIANISRKKNELLECNEALKNSIVFNEFGKVDYIDSYRAIKSTDESMEEISNQIFKLPPWIIRLMKIRDVIVRPFGLKTGKDFGFKDKNPKDYFFAKIAQTENELIMGETDRHLNFRVSVLIDRLSSLIYLTTVVHYNNRLGKVYFFFIRPFHKIIVKSAMNRYEATNIK